MKRLLCFVTFLTLCGCGLEDRTPKDPTLHQLVGVWDSMYGNPAVCRERLVLNSDMTFFWLTKEGRFTGSYYRNGDKISFLFSEKMTQLHDFRVNDQVLDMFTKNIQTRFVKIPLSLMNTKPCPEGAVPDPIPTVIPSPPTVDCPPCPPYPAPCPPCDGPRPAPTPTPTSQPRPTPTPTYPAPNPEPQPNPCPPCEPCPPPPPPPPPPPQPCPPCEPCQPPPPEPCKPCPPVVIKRGCHGYVTMPNPDPRCCK